jgi:recombination associated protein RdgC
MLGTRNIIPFQIAPKSVARAAMQDAFSTHALTDLGPLELERVGFVPAVPGQPDLFVREVGQFAAFSIGINKKILPASVVNERLGKKVAEIAEKEGRKVNSKERKRLRDDIVTEMLKQAFVKSSRINAWIDFKNGFVFVDASSRKNAELVVSEVRKALGSFPAIPHEPAIDVTVQGTFYEWLRNESATEQMALGDECVLASEETTWAGKHVNLCGTEVSEHLDAGSMPKRLGLSFDDRSTFLLDDELVVRKFKLTDVAVDSVSWEGEDAIGMYDTGLALVAGEVERLFAHLKELFRFQAPEAA